MMFTMNLSVFFALITFALATGTYSKSEAFTRPISPNSNGGSEYQNQELPQVVHPESSPVPVFDLNELAVGVPFICDDGPSPPKYPITIVSPASSSTALPITGPVSVNPLRKRQ